jgi:phage shock protein A
MSQPKGVEERLSVLEAAVAAMEPWRANATTRFTELEELVAGGITRLTALEAAAQGFGSRMGSVETSLAGGQAAIQSMAAEMAAMKVRMDELEGRMNALGPLARPGRTVIREQLDTLQRTVEDLAARLPDPPPEGGGTP